METNYEIRRSVIPTTKNTQSSRPSPMRSPEIREVARKLASLAVTRVRQDGRLNVRQGEQLRRALATAGDTLGWAMSGGDPVAEASKDVAKMAKSGVRSMTVDLAEELHSKKGEMKQLEDVASSVRELANDQDATYPTELTYLHTARGASQELVTHTETIIVGNAQEAQGVADRIEKSTPNWDKLREQMIVDLKQEQRRLDKIVRTTSDFVESLQGLLREVIVTLP